MRKLPFLLLVSVLVLPAFAAKRVTVEQLERVLAAARHKPDQKTAEQLSRLELIERFSSARLARWESSLPGPRSRRALVQLADQSAFLDPPAAEIPLKTPPDLATQRHIMALAVDYATTTIRQFPNFFATQDTIHFEDSPARQDLRGVDWAFTPYHPMHPVSRSSITVLYLDGQEIVDPESASVGRPEPVSQGLTTRGEFGPILGTVLVDAAHGTLTWSHWEQGPNGPLAVFRFVVPRENSHYQVEFCCIAGLGNSGVFRQFSGYHGEIAVDPAKGTILRLTLIANLTKADPIVESDILVEYGPVIIDGKTYICPVKSISISLAPVQSAEAMHMQNNRGELIQQSEQDIPSPLQTMLNEVEFEQYHLFHADVRVLPGGHEETAANATAPVAASVGRADTMNIASKQEVAQNPAQVAATENHASVAPDAAPVVASAVSVPAPAAPEISVAAAAALPEPSSSSLFPDEKTFTLHVTTRLVDVNVVALDKKGRPVTDLKAEDFEIDDNGRKQTVRFFSPAAGAPTEASAEGPDKHNHDATQPVVFNRRADMADAKSGVEATEASVTILLIDANNLAWTDLTYARDEILKFLRTLPTGERVGLYVQSGSGFQILVEGTTDHALLTSTLRQWMPSAQVLARAQEVEQRNRQQFDYVANQSDLQYVNGNISSTPDTATPVDPQLLDQGSNPGRDALLTLVGIARHLGALPGHKNVVWVASDNVLADWTDKSVGNDQGSKHIDGFILRAQEALNDAHASVYPLDVSQLETMAVDPAVKTRNVELSPGASGPPQPQGGGPSPGRVTAEMQQDLHPVQVAIQEMAKATGGRSLRRSGEIAKELNGVVADGQATYLLGFTPDVPADGQYHRLTVRLTARRGVTLRYRTGYLYSVEPSTLKDRFRQAIWQPFDANDIAVSARPVPASTGSTLKLNIATNDLALRLQGQRWMDKLDIFLVQRDEDGLHARITGQTLSLNLKVATYQSLLGLGIPFDQFIEKNPNAGSVRIVVVDENSGRMGSVTLPAAMLSGKS